MADMIASMLEYVHGHVQITNLLQCKSAGLQVCMRHAVKAAAHLCKAVCVLALAIGPGTEVEHGRLLQLLWIHAVLMELPDVAKYQRSHWQPHLARPTQGKEFFCKHLARFLTAWKQSEFAIWPAHLERNWCSMTNARDANMVWDFACARKCSFSACPCLRCQFAAPSSETTCQHYDVGSTSCLAPSARNFA